MQNAIASAVFPVLSHGIRLHERLKRGETPDFDAERAVLKGYLTNPEASRWTDFGGEGDSRSLSMTRRGDQFLGIRYALVSWLDEIFILDSPWGDLWNERKLETELYGTNIRAELFWEQARRAEGRPGIDALEVFFLCVMLGFRGDLVEQPQRLQEWAASVQARIARGQGQEWPMPPELDPPINVPPLHGREQVQRMVLIGGMLLLVVTLLVALFAVLLLR